MPIFIFFIILLFFSYPPAAQPDWVQVMSDSEVEISSELLWSCLSSGKPRPSVRWLRNGQPLTTQVSIQKILYTEHIWWFKILNILTFGWFKVLLVFVRMLWFGVYSINWLDFSSACVFMDVLTFADVLTLPWRSLLLPRAPPSMPFFLHYLSSVWLHVVHCSASPCAFPGPGGGERSSS